MGVIWSVGALRRLGGLWCVIFWKFIRKGWERFVKYVSFNVGKGSRIYFGLMLVRGSDP